MKKAMSNVDVAAIVAELQELMVGGFVGKAYQVSSDGIWITVQSPIAGRLDLLIEAGKRLHLTKQERVAGKTPPQFPTMIRAHMSGGRVAFVRQYEFDRVVEIGVERGEKRCTLIVELFPKGNAVLVDEDMTILLPLRPMSFRGRKLKTAEHYDYHSSLRDPRSVPAQYLINMLSTSDTDLVRTLVRGLNMSGLYAEEVCLRCGIDKATDARSLTTEEIDKVYESVRKVFSFDCFEPRIVYQDGSMQDVVPLPLMVHNGLESKPYQRFSDALDEFFQHSAPKPIKKQSAIDRRLDVQKAAIMEFNELEQENTEKAAFIYQHYHEVDAILSVVSSANAKGFSFAEIWDKISGSDIPASKSVKSIDYKGEIQLLIDGVTLEVNAMQTIPQNAERYYKKAKEMAKKSAGAKAALQATMKMAGAKAEAKKSRGAYRRKKPKWYERFRWFHSSDGFLVIGGRDVDSNEEIYAKYLEKRDLAMHTDAPGAPLTVIKTGGEEVPESTLQEAAIFAVSNSSLWKARVASGDCYMVKGDQVTKTPEHGEFLRKGSFVIRGERRYWRDVPLGLAIALVGDSLIGGPVSAVRAACNAKSRSQAEWPEDGELEAGEADHEKIDVMEIEPGEYNADDLGKRIYRFLAEKVDDRHFLKAVASVEQIVSFLPPGGSRLKQSVGVKDEEQE